VAAKVENTEQYGSTVAFQSSLTQALSAARQRGERPGSVFMHPYDQLEVIAGQGTAAAELTGQLAEYGVDLGYEDEVELYEPIGGGGVATGNGVAQKMLMPKAQLHVVQAQNADALVARLQGRQFDARTFNPAVDGAAVLQPGQYALSALGTPGFVQSAHVVSRGAVGEAMAVTGRMEGRFAGLYEPAGALALAAVIAAVRRNPADRSVKIAHGTGINTTPQKVQEFAVAARNEQLLTDAAMWDMISLANMDSRRALNDTELLGRALAAERAGRLAVRGGCRVASGR
jgi:threonine dehydratase